MISRELLSEVLGKHTTYSYIKVTEDFVQYVDDECYNPMRIDIYRMAHRCKAWALGKGYDIITVEIDDKYGLLTKDDWQRSKSNKKDVAFVLSSSFKLQDTEPEAIFEACQWILDNRDK